MREEDKPCEQCNVLASTFVSQLFQSTASAIATQCGIKTPDGLAMEGPKFRQLSDEEMDAILPKLQVTL
jgi:Ca2+-transporting ATPase